jgi:hypothetical protein
MKALLVSLALTVPLPSFAGGINLEAGYAKDYLRVEVAGDWLERNAPTAGIRYDMPLDSRGYLGLSFTARGIQHEDALIMDYGLEYWESTGVVEWFGGAVVETWGEEFAGVSRTLGGGRAGLRFRIGDLPFQLSGQYALGTAHVQRASVSACFSPSASGK